MLVLHHSFFYMCVMSHMGVIHKPRGQIFAYFWPPPPLWTLLLYMAYFIKWSFAYLSFRWPTSIRIFRKKKLKQHFSVALTFFKNFKKEITKGKSADGQAERSVWSFDKSPFPLNSPRGLCMTPCHIDLKHQPTAKKPPSFCCLWGEHMSFHSTLAYWSLW